MTSKHTRFKQAMLHAALAMTVGLLAPASHLLATPELRGVLHEPANLFDVGAPIKVEAVLREFAPAGQGEAKITVLDYAGKEVASKTQALNLVSGSNASVIYEGAALPPGYYEAKMDASVTAADGTPQTASSTVSFGVAPLVNRSASEARNGGYRFGVKKWNFGVAEWRGGIDWSEANGVAGSAALGLQWTRELFNQKEQLSTIDLIQKYPMNVVLKVERFPAELYDVQRYGPMGQWEQKYGRGAWALKTLPRQGPYKQWLAQQIRLIPPEQNVFEIWNEAWDKMSPEDFAVLCGWITDVILEVRPDAIIGPNLLGETSQYQFDARVIKAGGMKGMKMVALHPYGNSEDRQWLRDYRKWLREQLGMDPQIYVTEFGSHSTPEGPAARSEHEQAQRVVRQALALYAEGVTAFMPHTMGQSERNRTYLEDWFGMFRFNGQPKPVLMAYANAARWVDASRYVGDLWYGPEVEAMLFERQGTYVLALQTRGQTREVAVDAGRADVEVVDMVGTPIQAPVVDGKLKLTATADVIYLVGVSSDLAKSASTELRPDRWPQPAKPPRNARVARRIAAAPTLDGALDDWKGMTQIALQNPKVNPEDASGFGYLAWDEAALYVAVEVRDNEILNTRPRAKLYQQDSIELFISTEPRDVDAGYGPHDHQFFVTPVSAEGKPILGRVTDREAGVVMDVDGATFHAGKGGVGWKAEVAIPWSALPGLIKPAKGATIALEMRVNDADAAHERFKVDPIDGNVLPPDPTAWSLLKLE